MSEMNARDFSLWDQELAVESAEPYGADMLIDLSPVAEVGVLACVNALGSQLDDDSGGIDDQVRAFETQFIQPDIESLS